MLGAAFITEPVPLTLQSLGQEPARGELCHNLAPAGGDAPVDLGGISPTCQKALSENEPRGALGHQVASCPVSGSPSVFKCLLEVLRKSECKCYGLGISAPVRV